MELQRTLTPQLLGNFNHLNMLVDEAPYAVAVFDREMRYVMTNRAWIDTHGLQGKAIVGRTYAEVMPDLNDHWKTILTRALAGETLSNEQDRLDHGSGSVQYSRWKAMPWYAEGDLAPAGVAMFFYDITGAVSAILQREVAAANDAQRARKFATMLSEISQQLSLATNETTLVTALNEFAATYDVDLVSLFYVERTAPDGKPTEVSLAAAQKLGLPDDSSPMIGKTFPIQLMPSVSPVFGNTAQPTYLQQEAETDAAIRGRMQHLNVATAALVPLYSQSTRQWLGALAFSWVKPHTITFEERAIFSEIARTASAIVGSRRAYLAEQSIRERAESISRVSVALSQAGSESEVLAALASYATIKGAARLTLAYVETTNEQGGVETIRVMASWDGDKLDLNSPLLNRVMTNKEFPFFKLLFSNANEVLFVSDVATDSRIDDNARLLLLQRGVQSTVILPLYAQNAQGWQGTVTINWLERHTFTDDEQLVFEAIKRATATVVASRRAFTASDLARAESERLYLSAEALNNASSRQQLLEAATAYAKSRGATSSALYYFEETGGALPAWIEPVAQWSHDGNAEPMTGIQLADIPVTQLILAGPDQLTLIPDITTTAWPDLDSGSSKLLTRFDTRGMAFIPLNHRGRWLGALRFSWSQPHQFTASDRRFYAALAQQLRPVLDARILTENLEKTIEQRTKELRQLASVVEATSDVVGISEPGGKLIYLNRSARRLLEVSDDTPLDTISRDAFYGPEALERMQRDYIPVAIERGLWSGENDLVAFKSKMVYNVSQVLVAVKDANGNLEYLATIARDITDQKLNEATLIESNLKFDIAMEGAQLGLWDWNTVTNEVVFSERWASMLGYSLTDIKPHFDTFATLVHPDDLARISGLVQRYMSGEEPAYTAEFRMKTKDDKWKWVMAAGVGFDYTADGAPARMIGIHQDITDRVQAEKERERLIRQLRESSRYKDEFFAVMSHELRTPLNAMIGLLGITLMKGKLAPDDVNLVTRARANSDRLLTLINNILDLSRMEAGRMQLVANEVNLHTLIEKVRGNMSVLAEQKQLEFRTELDATLPDIVRTDEDALLKIVTNLLGNAFKFTEKGSVTLSIKPQGENFVLAVRDTGLGIPAHMHEIIFESFRQADGSSTRKHGGSGLGLSIVRNLCQAMGGTIRIESEPGQGSTFTVVLPMQFEKAPSTDMVKA
jgi:PAS domain S-box-containing protein